MNTASLKEIKAELSHRTSKELMEICLLLAKSKNENKEYLTYLLFESENEDAYIEGIKSQMDTDFLFINTDSFYYIKKSVRKILRELKKHILYSKNKETEVVLLIYFCRKLKDFEPSIHQIPVLLKLYERQVAYLKRKMENLHEDLQYDYGLELETLEWDRERWTGSKFN